MKTRIHVNQHVIRRNNKLTEPPYEPPITVKQGKTNTYCRSVTVNGPSTVVYSPDNPLSCGAKVWIVTEAPVVMCGIQCTDSDSGAPS